MESHFAQPSRRELYTVFGALMLGMLLAALDQTIVSTALPTIVGDLGGINHLSWVVTSYLVASTAAGPLYGKLGDMYGRKPVFIAAIVIFLAGSMLSGLSQNLDELVAFRAVQGIGAGGLMIAAMAIIGDLVPPRERGRYMGLIGGVFAVASFAGPLLGGFFVDTLSWRWVFYVNMPIGVVALAVTILKLKLPVARTDHRIDYLGATVLTGAVVTLILALTWGGNQYAWGSPTIVALFVATVVLVALFVAQERRAQEPVLPLHLFRSRVFTIANADGFLVGAAMFGALVFLPLYLQVVRGATPTRSGLQMLPLILGLLVASIGSGRVISRTGRYRAFPIVGGATIAFGMFLMSRLGVHTSLAVASVYMAVVGVGLGLVMQVLVLVVQNSAASRDIGVATSTVTFFRQIGGSAGVAIFGAIFAAKLTTELHRALPHNVATGRLNPTALQANPKQLHALAPHIQNVLMSSFANALHAVFLWAFALSIVAFAVSWLLPEVQLRTSSSAAERQQSEHGATADEPAAGAAVVAAPEVVCEADLAGESAAAPARAS